MNRLGQQADARMPETPDDREIPEEPLCDSIGHAGGSHDAHEKRYRRTDTTDTTDAF